MDLKEDVSITTSDFWYDLFDGGRIDPEKILDKEADVLRVETAIRTLKRFRDACEEVIDYI